MVKEKIRTYLFSLFRNKRFMLDEMFQKSKMAVLLYNTKTHVIFFQYGWYYFSLNKCAGIWRHRQGNSLVEKIAHKIKLCVCFVFLLKYAKFWCISMQHFIKHKPHLIHEKWKWMYFNMSYSIRRFLKK